MDNETLKTIERMTREQAKRTWHLAEVAMEVIQQLPKSGEISYVAYRRNALILALDLADSIPIGTTDDLYERVRELLSNRGV